MILSKGSGARKKTSIEILTPLVDIGDDPFVAAPDWASLVATEALRLGIKPKELPLVIRKCYAFPFIEKMIKFAPAKASASFDPKKHLDMNLATKWSSRSRDSQARDYLDPLILGGAPYDVLANLAMRNGSIPASAIETYEKLFYNCREGSGTQCMSPIRHHIMAYDGPAFAPANPNDPISMMKAVAAMYSYTALTDMLGFWDVASSRLSMSRREEVAMQHKVLRYRAAAQSLAGNMSHEDTISLLNSQQAYEKQLFEQEQDSVSDDGYDTVIQTWLAMMKPKLVPSSVKAAGESKEALDNRRKTENNIAKTKSGDKGIASAVEGHKKTVAGYLKQEAENAVATKSGDTNDRSGTKRKSNGRAKR